MTKQVGVTGPPVAMDRPAGQPIDLPKEENTRIVEMPQGKPRHDKPREQTSTLTPSKQKEQPAPPASPAVPESSRTAGPEAEQSTVSPVPSEEAGGGPAPASGIAPTRKVLAAGAGGGGIGVPVSIILSYHLELPTEIAVAYSGLLVASLSFLAGYLVPAER